MLKRLAVAGVVMGTVACSTTIEGRVTKEGSSSPISGARVQIGEPYGYTDSQGRYALDVEDEETYDVLVSAPAFQARTQEIRVGDVDELNLDFALAAVPSAADARREPGAADVRVDVQSHSQSVEGAKAEEKVTSSSLQSSSPRAAGVLQGRVRTITPIEFAGHDEWSFARVTTESGDSTTLAFADHADPESVGLEAGAEVRVDGRYTRVASQRVLIVKRLTVNGVTRLDR